MARNKVKVKMLGRAGLEYAEGRRRMLIDSEMLVGERFDLVIYADSIRRWEPPHDAEAVTAEARSQIKQNINAALSRLRIEWA